MFLGIDIGTGSSKAVLATADGTIVDSAQVSHSVSLPRPDWAEFDAEQAWAEVAALCSELFSRNDAADVAGLAVSAMGPCLVVTDDTLTPLRPTILYGIDGRAAREIDDLNAEFGPDAIFADGGKALSAQAVGPKLRWIENHEPEVFAAATRWFGLSSFLVARLTGEYVQDHHTASQCDPLYDLRANTWHGRAVGVTKHLAMPRLAWPAEVVGQVTAAAAEHTGLAVGTPVCAGTVDAWAEAFSAGARRPGDLMLMYGSTMFFVQTLDSYRAVEGLWMTTGIEPGSLTLAAGMSTSGSLTEWFQRLTGDVPFETLVAEAEAAPPGSDGLITLPYFAGERTPIFDPDARGLIVGLTLRHDRGHLFRSIYEGIGFGIRSIVDFMESVGQPVGRLVAVGGGTKGSLWTRVVSDITGREQVVPEQTIGASYGDALLAAIGTGAVSADTDWAVASTVIEPDPAHRELYDSLYSNYLALYPDVVGHMHALARIQSHGGSDATLS